MYRKITENEENFKITTPLDFELAKLIVKDFIRKEKDNLWLELDMRGILISYRKEEG